MFAAFGPIYFQVIASPTKLEIEKKYHYEALSVIGAPEILQWIYDKLRHIDITIYLHQMYVNPQTALAGITTFADAHIPQFFVFGNNQNLGQYVISNYRIKHKWLASDGTVIATEIDLELTEWISSPIPGATPVPTYLGNPAISAPSNPPGLSGSQTSAPGSTLVVSPSTASPSGVAPASSFSNVPLTTIARWN